MAKDGSTSGFDDIEARLKLPLGMTAVRSYKGRMSAMAAQILVEQIQGSAEIRQAVIDTAIAAGKTVRNRNEYN